VKFEGSFGKGMSLEAHPIRNNNSGYDLCTYINNNNTKLYEKVNKYFGKRQTLEAVR